MSNFQHTHYLERIENGFLVTEQVTGTKTYYKDTESIIEGLVTEEVRPILNESKHFDGTPKFKLTLGLQQMKQD